jgi:hypothetical protein
VSGASWNYLSNIQIQLQLEVDDASCAIHQPTAIGSIIIPQAAAHGLLLAV